MSALRLLEPSEVDVAASTLASAFEEDPLFRYLLPDDGQRQAWLNWFQAHALRESLAAGGAVTLESPAQGAIGYFPAGTWPSSMRTFLQAARLPPGWPPFRFLRTGLAIETKIQRMHPKVNHLYIYVLGVHPREKGKGFGGALIRHACAKADEVNAVAYLETSNPVNVPLYRRFGFEVVEEFAMHRSPPVWTMQRNNQVSERMRENGVG